MLKMPYNQPGELRYKVRESLISFLKSIQGQLSKANPQSPHFETELSNAVGDQILDLIGGPKMADVLDAIPAVSTDSVSCLVVSPDTPVIVVDLFAQREGVPVIRVTLPEEDRFVTAENIQTFTNEFQEFRTAGIEETFSSVMLPKVYGELKGIVDRMWDRAVVSLSAPYQIIQCPNPNKEVCNYRFKVPPPRYECPNCHWKL